MPAPHPKEIRDKAISLYQNGYTLDEVGNALGINRITVYRWLVKYGIKRRPNHARPGVMAKEKNPAWKGGKIKREGYVLIWNPEISKYVPEHRLNAEDILGRELTPKEIVHHKNGVRHDNKKDNLLIMDRGTHGRLHNIKYDDNHLIHKLESLEEKLGRRPTVFDIRARKGKMPSLITYYRRFGSFKAALEQLRKKAEESHDNRPATS